MRIARHAHGIARRTGILLILAALVAAMSQVAVTAFAAGGDHDVCGGEFWVKWEAGKTADAPGTWERSDDWDATATTKPTLTVEVVTVGDDGPWEVYWTADPAATKVGVKAATNLTATWPGGTSGTVTGWHGAVNDGPATDHAISFIVWCFEVEPPPSIPDIELVKTANPTSVAFTEGEVASADVVYTYKVTNTGDVALNGVRVHDDTLDQDVTLGTTSLDPGASTSGTITITVTPADVGTIENIATATGWTVEEEEVTDTDDATVTVTFSKRPPPPPPPPPIPDPVGIDIVKTPDVSTIEYVADDGDDEVITYTYVITNTGDVTLTGVTLVDDVLGTIALPDTTLSPDESVTVTATHVVTADEVGTTIVNVATTTGTSTDNRTVTDEADAEVTVTEVAPLIIESASIEVVKTPDVEQIAYDADDGDDETVTYTYVITNTGDVTLTGVTLTDDVLGTITLPDTTLEPGESVTGTATHVVTLDDVDAGTIENTATVTGATDDGRTVTDDDTASVDVSQVLGVVIEAPENPAPEPAPEVEYESLPMTGLTVVPALLWALAFLGSGVVVVRNAR